MVLLQRLQRLLPPLLLLHQWGVAEAEAVWVQRIPLSLPQRVLVAAVAAVLLPQQQAVVVDVAAPLAMEAVRQRVVSPVALAEGRLNRW